VTCALRLLAQWFLVDVGFEQLQLQAETRNTASIRVAEKAGYSILRDEIRVLPCGLRHLFGTRSRGGCRALVVEAVARNSGGSRVQRTRDLRLSASLAS
jgi:hypothetical protein